MSFKRSNIFEATACLLLVATMMLWNVRMTGGLTWRVAASFLLVVFLCWTYGRSAANAAARFFGIDADIAFVFLSGFFIYNTLLFVMVLVSPLGMAKDMLLLGLLGMALAGFRLRRAPAPLAAASSLPAFLAILTSVIGATIWSTDAQHVVREDHALVFQIWQDVFIHVREISVFAQSHGLKTIFDIKYAGASAPIYHFASYMSASAVALLGDVTAMDAYAGFQLPLGVMLTGLAAYTLAASIWGPWPGFAGVVAVLLVPDAYQQGFGNRYLSYNFLSQVNLGMLYGMACVAVAWIFILNGCRRAQPTQVVAGYVVLAVCVFYKAHIFVANAYLILIYPCLFYTGVKWRWRIVVGITFTLVFAAIVTLSQNIGRIPVLRLDGSGISQYLITLLSDYDPGVLKSFFRRVLIVEKHSKLVDALHAVVLLLTSTFGLLVALTPAVALAGRRRFAPAIFWFPALVTANYIIMAMGLALDNRDVGTPDELLNRPLVWAYFAVAAWTGGAACYLAAGHRFWRRRGLRISAVGALCGLTATTALLARNLQTFPARPGYSSFSEFNAVPECLAGSAEYLRRHSASLDIIQDSSNDPKFILTALAERQLYAANSSFGGKTQEYGRRLNELAALKQITDVTALRERFFAIGLMWYVQRPGSRLAWPDSVLSKPAFACDGYRVYSARALTGEDQH